MKKIAVLLSGCGYLDGSEITEAVSTLISLSELKCQVKCFSTDKEFTEINHLNQKETEEKRNMLAESSRIARGEIQRLDMLDVNSFDGLAIPGGAGSVISFCSWGTSQSACEVDKLVASAIIEFHRQSKPILAICISPALVARVLGEHGPELTIGNDSGTATEIEKTGSSHVVCPVEDFVSDRLQKVISTPAYMLAASPFQIYSAIRNATKEFVEMA